jgi:hypothetical protein
MCNTLRDAIKDAERQLVKSLSLAHDQETGWRRNGAYGAAHGGEPVAHR